ncbi:MAG: YkvA family protein [Thermomicrobiales bacterium]
MRWRERAARLRREIYAVALAARDPRVPWYARVLAVCIAAYALSPLDLIPDPIPVLGYIDDVILIPLGIALLLRLIPADVLSDGRARAGMSVGTRSRMALVGTAAIVALWILSAVAIVLTFRAYG